MGRPPGQDVDLPVSITGRARGAGGPDGPLRLRGRSRHEPGLLDEPMLPGRDAGYRVARSGPPGRFLDEVRAGKAKPKSRLSQAKDSLKASKTKQLGVHFGV